MRRNSAQKMTIRLSSNLITTCLTAILISAPCFSQSVKFRPQKAEKQEYSEIGGRGVVSFGIYTETVIPFKSSFATRSAASLPTVVANNTDFRYQVPVGFGVDLSYGLTEQIEIGVAAGFELFETQQLISEDNTAGGPTKQFDRIKARFYPVTGIFRYRFIQKRWAPEIEVGIGGAFGSIEVKSTITTEPTLKEDAFYLRGHLAAGAGFSWANNASVHFQAGYSLTQLGAKTYDSGANLVVDQSESFQGIYAKGFVRYHF